ncbi:MAG: hypothetical protein M5T61_12790 [Acidimicrobiia bacterium]|nr:hypothetical protein [Acidimicrobiia bacterium]
MCTANVCRSPMAEALLRLHLRAAAVSATAASAGTRAEESLPAAPYARRAVPGLGEHRSRRLTSEMISAADLVLAMANEHLREVVAAEPDSFVRSFTLRDFAARAARHGARSAGETFSEWVAAVAADRSVSDLVATTSPAADDIADPMGGELVDHQITAAELSHLLRDLVTLAWPPQEVRASGARPPSARARDGSRAGAS